MNELDQKVLDKLNELEVGPVRIFKCSNAGRIVGNGFGMEFGLPDYAVVTEEDLMMKSDEVYMDFAEFEFENNIDTFKFCEGNYDTEGLYEQLKRDGYKVIWTSE